MSYIFMKILEKRPGSYDAGIAKYAAGDFGIVREEMLSRIQEGDRVLDVGCGPGTFAIECARRGATVEAVDVNPQMLYTADLSAANAGVQDKIHFHQMAATELEFEPGSFDAIVFSLSMSELREVEQMVSMNTAYDLLKPDGKLIVADEVVPQNPIEKIRYHLRRTALYVITRIIARDVTQPVRAMESKFGAAGFEISKAEAYERGSLKLVVGCKMPRRPAPESLPAYRLPVWAEVLAEIYGYLTLVFRPCAIQTGLYRIGNPTKDSPVLVTANFILTFTSVRKHLRGLDCYLLVIDSRGINVWCAAGKGNFSAKEIAYSIRATRVDDLVDTRRLILPKLSANGVRYREIKQLTGWDAAFGPIYASDIPEYFRNGYVLTDGMRRVEFTLSKRLWVAIPFSGFIGFWFVLPLLFFRNLYSPAIPAIALAAGITFPVTFYLLPTDRFFKKGLVLGLLGAVAAAIILIGGGAPPRDIIMWALTIVGITLFVAMDFSGMSPVSNYSKIKEEYYVVVPLLGIILATVLAMRFLWR
jgi:2-polyprenyl-3-methyl-5-hydroxy-6-metoxy-1,4-benzoquinol methylase